MWWLIGLGVIGFLVVAGASGGYLRSVFKNKDGEIVVVIIIDKKTTKAVAVYAGDQASRALSDYPTSTPLATTPTQEVYRPDVVAEVEWLAEKGVPVFGQLPPL